MLIHVERIVTCCALVTALLMASPLHAQQGNSAAAPQFEVASIKPAAFSDAVRANLLKLGGRCGLPALERSGNRVRVPFSQLCGLIRLAYDVGDYQVVGLPNREASNFFEVEARAANGSMPTLDETRSMIQTLLGDRFQLRVRREPRDVPVYVLTIAKGEPKMNACSNPSAPSLYSPGRILSCQPPLTTARVAQFLSRETDRPVLIGNGLADTYTFELHWLPERVDPQPDSPPTLFTAIQEQLGLKLEPGRGLVDTIVVDHAEAPTPN